MNSGVQVSTFNNFFNVNKKWGRSWNIDILNVDVSNNRGRIGLKPRLNRLCRFTPWKFNRVKLPIEYWRLKDKENNNGVRSSVDLCWWLLVIQNKKEESIKWKRWSPLRYSLIRNGAKHRGLLLTLVIEHSAAAYAKLRRAKEGIAHRA